MIYSTGRSFIRALAISHSRSAVHGTLTNQPLRICKYGSSNAASRRLQRRPFFCRLIFRAIEIECLSQNTGQPRWKRRCRGGVNQYRASQVLECVWIGTSVKVYILYYIGYGFYLKLNFITEEVQNSCPGHFKVIGTYSLLLTTKCI